MHQVIRSSKALADLDDIWEYIARDNIAAADRVIDAIDQKCRRLASNPRMGTAPT